MPDFSFQVDVRATPDQVMAAYVDFSDRRPEIWPNLTARLYKVHDLGPATADVTEGTAVLGLVAWERVSYTWTDSVVRTVITDGSIYEAGGIADLRVEPRGDGSRITVDFRRRPKTLLGRCVGGMMQLTRGAVIKRTLRQVYGKAT